MNAPRFPFSPFPAGWFAVAFSDEIAPGEVKAARIFDQAVVVFRTESGEAGVLDAFCPHMGAHLGIGGRVQGESIRCPMHAFRFDTAGRCVATGYGTRPPPKCVSRAWRVLERNGGVFVWHHPDGAEPAWEPPVHNRAGWSPIRTKIWRDLPSHPQETTENSVDFGHLSVVHGYRNVRVLSPLHTDGPYLTARYGMTRTPLVRGMPAIHAAFHIHVWGLGYSFVEAEIPEHHLRTRHYVFATPNEGRTITLRIGMSFQTLGWLGRIPVDLLDRLVGAALLKSFAHDVYQDFEIWGNKRYVHPPALAEGDGPVGAYRRWARQFYPEGLSNGAEAAE